MANQFRWLFNIVRGEEKKVFLCFFLAFVWAFAVTWVLEFSEALFLIRVGSENLPKAYTGIACLMLVMAPLFLRSFHLFPVQKIFMGVIGLGLSFYTVSYFYLITHVKSEAQWIWYFIRISSFFLLSSFTSCYWTFIDQFFPIHGAKRLFSLFSSGVFLGTAIAGVLIRSGLFAFHQVIFCSFFLLLGAFVLVFYISKTLSVVEEGCQEEQLEDSSFKTFLKEVLASPYTLSLMVGNLLLMVLLYITEFNYFSYFDTYFPHADIVDEKTAGITLFIGQVMATISVANLLFGLLFYSRVLKKVGITTMMLFTPILLCINFCGWIVTPSLLFPMIGYLIVEGSAYVIDDSNFNLSLNGVPTKIKYKSRVFIESFSEPFGVLICAVILNTVPHYSKHVGLVLAVLFLACVLLVRKYFFSMLHCKKDIAKSKRLSHLVPIEKISSLSISEEEQPSLKVVNS